MRCQGIRDSLLESWPEGVPEPVRAHLSACPGCRAYARDMGMMRAGFQALADEPVPEPSWGFRERLLRRLDEAAERGAAAEEFFERVGRRVVYAAGFLALVLLLVLAWPSTGPLRSPTAAELYWAQSDVSSVGTYLAFSDESADVPEVTPGAPKNGGPGKKP